MVMRVTSAVAVATVVLLVAAGCKTGPEIVPSTGPRSATTPDQVKIYQAPPLKYERLGVVTVPARGDIRWDENANADTGFDRLKEQAAQKGANGLLLVVDPKEHYGRILAGYHDQFYQVPYRLKPDKAAVAEAIYVHKEY